METATLPSFYFGPIQYFTKFLLYSPIFIEEHENFPKQTYRNRCNILSANGLLSLQVPVEKGSVHKICMRDLRVSYDKPWQKNHFKSIESAYRTSPFYEYYIDDLVPVFTRKYDFLLDLNHEINKIIFDILKIRTTVEATLEYHSNPVGADFRTSIHPKVHRNKADFCFKPIEYTQVFAPRFGFVENLSILDALFCLGPDTREYLGKCTGF